VNEVEGGLATTEHLSKRIIGHCKGFSQIFVLAGDEKVKGIRTHYFFRYIWFR
jgi:hypothetical protein